MPQLPPTAELLPALPLAPCPSEYSTRVAVLGAFAPISAFYFVLILFFIDNEAAHTADTLTTMAVLGSHHKGCGLWVVCMIDFHFSTEIMGTLHREFITRNTLPHWRTKRPWLLLQQYFIDFTIRRSVPGATGLILPHLEEEDLPRL